MGIAYHRSRRLTSWYYMDIFTDDHTMDCIFTDDCTVDYIFTCGCTSTPEYDLLWARPQHNEQRQC